VMRPEFAEPPGPGPFVIVVARAVRLAGVVLDGERRPLASAEVAVAPPFDLRARFDTVLDSSSLVATRTRTDAEGRFEIAAAPLVPDSRLETTHATFLDDSRALPDHDELALEIVLRPARAEPKRLVGTVVDALGLPVEGAWVGLGVLSARTGSSGAFAFDLEASTGRMAFPGHETTPLRAVKAGHLSAEIPRPLDGRWPDPLVLTLGGPPPSIEGRVVGPDGRPVAGAEVWTSEEARFGFVEAAQGERTMKVLATVESIQRGEGFSKRAKADADGRFELKGLLARDYRVHALDKKTMLATTETLSAGVRGVEIEMPREELAGRVAGRVKSLSGEPIAGARVVLERRTAGAQGAEVERLQSEAATTDAEGRFEFEGVARAANSLLVSGDEIDLTGFHQAIAAGADLEELEVSVPLRVRAQIDAGAEADFTRCEVLDAAGKRLNLSLYHGTVAFSMQAIHVQQGRSEVFSVSEEAQTLVLFQGDAEVRRVPLKLARGELNVLKP
jgi:hypothetical protein